VLSDCSWAYIMRTIGEGDYIRKRVIPEHYICINPHGINNEEINSLSLSLAVYIHYIYIEPLLSFNVGCTRPKPRHLVRVRPHLDLNRPLTAPNHYIYASPYGFDCRVHPPPYRYTAAMLPPLTRCCRTTPLRRRVAMDGHPRSVATPPPS
jgi:hypothetical protein